MVTSGVDTPSSLASGCPSSIAFASKPNGMRIARISKGRRSPFFASCACCAGGDGSPRNTRPKMRALYRAVNRLATSAATKSAPFACHAAASTGSLGGSASVMGSPESAMAPMAKARAVSGICLASPPMRSNAVPPTA